MRIVFDVTVHPQNQFQKYLKESSVFCCHVKSCYDCVRACVRACACVVRVRVRACVHGLISCRELLLS